MLKFNDVTHEVVGRLLFKEINFSFNRLKYGLVGPNGVGKSTFARILARLQEPTRGHVMGASSVLYLPQEEKAPATSVSEFNIPIWNSPAAKDPRIIELLNGIMEDRNLNELSGGEWMRLRLANALKENPQFLILDEPTNNLDRSGRDVIHKFIESFEGGLLLISHDRTVLEIMDEILELSNQGLQRYGGGFSFYEQNKTLERDHQERVLNHKKKEKSRRSEEREQKIRRQEKRMRDGAKKVPNLGMPKILIGGMKRNSEKTIARLNRRESEFVSEASTEADLAWKKMKVDPFIRFDFEASKPAASKVHFSTEGVNWLFSSSAKPLWSHPKSFVIKGSERWLLSGSNGSGKSTLIKILLDQAEASGRLIGELYRGQSSIAYLDQSYENLNPDKSLIDHMLGQSRFDPVELRNELAFFGFTGMASEQLISGMSGGEKLKASLACAFLGRRIPEVMILDEPTNNLDLQSLNLLERAIQKFEGALIVVSHDDHFLRNIKFDHGLKF